MGEHFGCFECNHYATGTIFGDVSGASRLYYTGDPTLGTIHTSGASSISKKSFPKGFFTGQPANSGLSCYN
jgi:hypothetical protein